MNEASFGILLILIIASAAAAVWLGVRIIDRADEREPTEREVDEP